MAGPCTFPSLGQKCLESVCFCFHLVSFLVKKNHLYYMLVYTRINHCFNFVFFTIFTFLKHFVNWDKKRQTNSIHFVCVCVSLSIQFLSLFTCETLSVSDCNYFTQVHGIWLVLSAFFLWLRCGFCHPTTYHFADQGLQLGATLQSTSHVWCDKLF